jgi:cytoskeleton protein RodZ
MNDMTPANSASVGASLAAAREARGLTAAQVAEQLKYLPRQIDALESGDHGQLPGGIFTRGMIRTYAHLVGLDADALLASGDAPAALGASARVTAPSERIRLTAPSFGPWIKLGVATVVLLGLVVLIYKMLSGAPEDEVPATGATQTEARNPRPLAPAVGTEMPLPELAETTEPAALSNDAASAEAVPSEPALTEIAELVAKPATDAPKPAEATAPPRAKGVITLSFDGDAWTQISDGQGKSLMSQLNPAGAKRRIEGEPPFSLTVGNAAHVKMTYNGAPFDLKPFINVTVARITLE